MKEVLRVIVIIFFKLFFKVSIVNRENVPEKGGAILCSNHIGELDMFLIGFRLKRLVHWMAKEELFKNPLLSAFIRWLGAFPVKRGKPDIEAIKNAIALVNEGHIVGIFPEGTRMRNKNKRNIKVSNSPILIAEKTGAPIIPVAIQGNYKLFSRINVIFGKPFYIESSEDSGEGSEQTKYDGVKIMNNIYALLEEN